MMIKSKVGWIGLGIMGLPMARNLQRKGFFVKVVGHLRREPVELMKREGAEEVTSPLELAHECNVIFSMVSNEEQTEDVVFGENGLLEGLTKDHLVVICSTLTPHYCASLAERVKQISGARLICAPVTGAPWGAESATLTFIAGGARSDYEKCMPFFEAMGRNFYYVGDRVEAGLAVKLVNNLMAIVNGEVVKEGISLAQKAGVEIKTLFDIVKLGTADSYVVRNWEILTKLSQEHPQQSRAYQKDLEYAIEYASRIGLDLPLTKLALMIRRSWLPV
jgi:3-hydroxyisobutyrate dehydrogenase-like beta-hydroxyacid dehydrogenase